MHQTNLELASHAAQQNRLPEAVKLASQACIATLGELESASVQMYMQMCWRGGRQWAEMGDHDEAHCLYLHSAVAYVCVAGTCIDHL